MSTLATHFERSFEKDLEHIRQGLLHMGQLGEAALRKSLQALKEKNRQLAYAIVLGDRRIDEMEREIDHRCQEFLVRQQPVAGPLRFAYSTIRINLELERVGDYAESIARQVLKLIGTNVEIPLRQLTEIAELAIPMLHNAVKAFVEQDVELATTTMGIEDEVDILRNKINADLFELRKAEKIPLEALTPLMTIARRYERVSDQAKNICEEVLYCATGEYTRHKGERIFRVLFLDSDGASRGPMAAALGNSLRHPDLVCASVALEPREVDSGIGAFAASKGLKLERSTSLKTLPSLEQYPVIIGLAKGLQKAVVPLPRKTIYLEWNLPSEATSGALPGGGTAAYEAIYREINGHIHDLAEAILEKPS